MAGFNEKRIHKRSEFTSPVYYSDLLHAESRNISGGGVCLETDRKLPKDSLQYMVISLFPYMLMKETGTVVWNRKTERGTYIIGLRFTHINAYNSSVVNRFIKTNKRIKVKDCIEIRLADEESPR